MSDESTVGARAPRPMSRHKFLVGIHRVTQPRNYLEIGLGDGRGLACSNVPTIGVDPAPMLQADLTCDLELVTETSDDFFARPDPIGFFAEDSVDLTFIDGMHLFEFALRDFINAERVSSPTSVVIFDDMLPRVVPEAARDRHTMQWAGDVYKLVDILSHYRPDLTVLTVNTRPTGMAVVVGLDPSSTVLSEHYDEIVAAYGMADPQPVSLDIIHRRSASNAEQLLTSPVWSELATARSLGSPAPASVALLADLRGTADYSSNPPVLLPFPPGRGAIEWPQFARATYRRARGLLRTLESMRRPG